MSVITSLSHFRSLCIVSYHVPFTFILASYSRCLFWGGGSADEIGFPHFLVRYLLTDCYFVSDGSTPALEFTGAVLQGVHFRFRTTSNPTNHDPLNDMTTVITVLSCGKTAFRQWRCSSAPTPWYCSVYAPIKCFSNRQWARETSHKFQSWATYFICHLTPIILFHWKGDPSQFMAFQLLAQL